MTFCNYKVTLDLNILEEYNGWRNIFFSTKTLDTEALYCRNPSMHIMNTTFLEIGVTDDSERI